MSWFRFRKETKDITKDVTEHVTAEELKDIMKEDASQKLLDNEYKDSSGQIHIIEDIVSPSSPEPTPPDPKPDLETKPADIVGYCFGYACPNGHLQEFFDNISVDGYKQRRACKNCGKLSYPAIVKRIAEARWDCLNMDNIIRAQMWNVIDPPPPKLGWTQSGAYYSNELYIWTRYEFVSYLEPLTSVKKSVNSPSSKSAKPVSKRKQK